MSKDNLVSALNEISEFIKSLDIAEEFPKDFECDLFFSQADEGTLFLNGNEAAQYSKCLKLLIDSVGNKNISQKTIEALYQNTILTVLDIHKKREYQSFEFRLENAINKLRASLTASPTYYTVYYPIGGLAEDGLPIKVGNVLFCIFDEVHQNQFIKLLSNYEGKESEKAYRLVLANEIKQSKIVDKPVGIIKVSALDYIASKALAKKELILTIDVVNFFSDLIPYQKGYIFLPSESERKTINVPQISNGKEPRFSFEWEVVGPLMPLSFRNLLVTNKQRDLGFTKVTNLLSSKRSNLEDRLISAIQWAGRATTENRKEEAFLLYAISLESLVLLDNEREELTYRLCTRVAHLLGKDLENRSKISNKVRDLYNIRSKIVHSGSYQVTDADLSLIRYYSKNCALKIINDEPFYSMENIDSLIKWFNEKILS